MAFSIRLTCRRPSNETKPRRATPVAQFHLALKHDAAGQSATAAAWYLKAADAGLAQAQFNYAWMLEKGVAGKQDTPLAALYYERAARQGLVEARYNFALMLAEGRGVLEDDQAAAHVDEARGRSGLCRCAIPNGLPPQSRRGRAQG